MQFRHILFLVTASAILWADAPLKGALGLSMDQAKQAQEIEKKHWPAYQAKRGELARQMRKVRTARVNNDRPALEAAEPVARRLHGEMMALQAAEDAEIRTILTPEQNKKFDAYLKQRRDMVGASRDDKEFTGR